MLARNLPKQTDYKSNIVCFLVVVVLFVLFVLLLGRCLDQYIDNQNVMFCNSAKVSGNVEVLNKCHDFYLNGNVKELRKEF